MMIYWAKKADLIKDQSNLKLIDVKIADADINT